MWNQVSIQHASQADSLHLHHASQANCFWLHLVSPARCFHLLRVVALLAAAQETSFFLEGCGESVSESISRLLYLSLFLLDCTAVFGVHVSVMLAAGFGLLVMKEWQIEVNPEWYVQVLTYSANWLRTEGLLKHLLNDLRCHPHDIMSRILVFMDRVVLARI